MIVRIDEVLKSTHTIVSVGFFSCVRWSSKSVVLEMMRTCLQGAIEQVF